jgi:DNA-directed RNA polymerase specialized sigma24 family protein
MSIPVERRDRVLREALRHYLEFEAFCTQYGKYIVEHKGVEISFIDLQGLLKNLSPRKMQAVWLNVVVDMKQREVAEIMGIRTVTVGQYVESAIAQLVDQYFAEEQS